MTTGNSTTSTFSTVDDVDPLDELAALFLTGPDSKDVSKGSQERQQPAFRELLIAGNLPVRGGLWLTPYADAIARDNGATALVRLDLTPPTLELLRSNRSSLSAHDATLTFQQAVMDIASDVAVWIVRAPSTINPTELLHLDFDRITILTGDDSAAVVAAYQLIKELVHGASTSAHDTATLPPIALALAGAGEAAAGEIMDRINKAAEVQLGIEIELASCVSRMDSGIKCNTFASFTETHAPQVDQLLGWLDEVEGVNALGETEGSSVEGSEIDVPPSLRLTPMVDLEESNQQHSDAIGEHEDLHATDPHVAYSAAELKLAPKPSIHANGVDQRRAATGVCDLDSLSAHIAGLSLLPVRHPDYESIELAVDHDGLVHVVARDDSLREMRIVESWVQKHKDLVMMACGDIEMQLQGEITCHIVTSEPATLADLHGTGLQLHVLAPVTIDGKSGWYAAPLNA